MGQLKLRSIAWLDFLLAGAHLFFAIWATQFFVENFLFQLEVTLPTGIWVMVPALVYFVVLLCNAIEKSNSVEIFRDDSGAFVTVVKKIKAIKVKRNINEINNVFLRPFRFSIESGIVAGFQVLIGLGLTFHGYELYDDGCFTQSLPFLTYGIFSLGSVIAWLLLPPKELQVNFEDKSQISLRFYSYSRNVRTAFNTLFLGRDIPKIKNNVAIKGKNSQGLLFLGVLAGLFCINHFTFAFAYQMVDSIALLLLLAFGRRVWLHIQQPAILLWVEKKQDSIQFVQKNQPEKALNDILFPHQVRAKEWFLWLYMAYEMGWKFWYVLTLVVIDGTLWNSLILFIIVGYSLYIFAFLWRMINSSSKKWPLLKWILFGIFIIAPLNAILSASGVLGIELSIVGIRVIF